MPEVILPNGVTINYELSGVDGPVLLLVNGLTMDLTLWQQLAGLLADFRVLRYDQRGQGGSSKPAGPYLAEQHASDLNALLDALEADAVLPAGGVHAAALSNGGGITLLAAAERPGRFRSVALLHSYLKADVKLRLALEAWQQSHEQGGNPLRFAITTPWIWGRSFLEQNIEDLEPFRTAPAAISPHAYQALLAGALAMESAEPALARYPGPLLAVTGDEDVLTPEPYAQEFISAAGRGRSVILPGVGHAGPLERPALFAPLLRDFIQAAERNAHAG